MGLTGYDADGTLEIDGVLMNRPAWMVGGDENGNLGLARLWIEFDIRGEDRILPSVTGVIPYQRRMTATRKDLRIIIVGDVDENGDPVADSRVGLQQNLDYLYENVVQPVNSSTGTREAVLTVPGGSNREAIIHVLGIVSQTYHLGECGSIMIGTLQISIPFGRFAVPTS